jgi:branched-chain amino acid transport system substrate-binding protein
MRPRSIHATALALTCLMLSACGVSAAPAAASVSDPWGAIRIGADNPIRIGAALATDDPLIGAEGAEQRRGIELAIQRRQHVLGASVQIVEVPSGCSGTAAANALVADPGVVAVIGDMCSSACLDEAPIFESAHYTMISPGCSATSLTDEFLHVDSFMRTIYTDSREGEVAGRFAYSQLGARRVAVVTDGTIESTETAAAFVARFEQQGGVIVAEYTVDPAETNFRPAFAELSSFRPDLLYAPLLGETGSRLALQMGASAMSSTPVLGGRHFLSESFIMGITVRSSGIYAVGPFVSGGLYEDQAQAYTLRYGQPPGGVAFAFAYDATALLLQAIENAAVPLSNREYSVGRTALRQQLYGTFNYSGVTGSLTCTQWGDCSVGDIAAYEVRGSAWSAIYIP